MPHERDNIALLIKELDTAFGDLPTPDEGHIVYDNSGYHLECEQVRAHFCQRHWQELSIDELENEASSLSFFTPEAFRFYLPAFIKVSLLDPVRADVIPDGVLASLADPLQSAYIDELSESQKHAVRHFIDFLRNHRSEEFYAENLDAAEQSLLFRR